VTDEDNSQGTDAAEAFEAMCVELALLRRAVEGLAAERGAIDVPDYTETLGRMQQGVDATAARVALINDVIVRSPALAMTPEQMAQRIAAVGNAARREDQAALAKAVDYGKINYLMLMMVDPHVHFHVIPRYEGSRSAAGLTIRDAGWPGQPDLGSAIKLDSELDRVRDMLKVHFDNEMSALKD